MFCERPKKELCHMKIWKLDIEILLAELKSDFYFSEYSIEKNESLLPKIYESEILGRLKTELTWKKIKLQLAFLNY
jgi:hypothetical protein